MSIRIADLTYFTEDHPAANGRTPLPGEEAWILRFPLENGRILAVEVGVKGLCSLKAMVREMTVDDDIEAAFLSDPANAVTRNTGEYHG